MSNENNSENQAVPVQPDAATTPIDLAAAFKMLNQANRETAEEHVEDGADTGTDEEVGSDGSGVLSDSESETSGDVGENAVDAGDNSGVYADDGGSTSSIEAIDFNAYKQDLLREVQNNAIQQVRQEFAEQNIGYYSAGELTVRDEQTGRVMFRNPDVQDERDPNYYFSSRTEMQQFVDAWNRSIDSEFRRAVNEKQQELYAYAAPKARLADFLPRWNKMDKNTKAVFDELLEGHEIRDASGKEIGFNVDLDSVANQAEKIAKRFSSSSPQSKDSDNSQQKQASDGPALNMPSGNGESEFEGEPKNIGEALKMYDKKNRGK